TAPMLDVSVQVLRTFSVGCDRRKTSTWQFHPSLPVHFRRISRSWWDINLAAASDSPERWGRIRSKCFVLRLSPWGVVLDGSRRDPSSRFQSYDRDSRLSQLRDRQTINGGRLARNRPR